MNQESYRYLLRLWSNLLQFCFLTSNVLDLHDHPLDHILHILVEPLNLLDEIPHNTTILVLGIDARTVFLLNRLRGRSNGLLPHIAMNVS
jgi:hypothetical protein